MHSRLRRIPRILGNVSDALYLAALAVCAIDHLDVVGTRPPLVHTDDFTSGGVLDSQGRKWIVRCPRNSEAATMIETEAALAPFLLEELRAGALPFDIIRPAGFAQSDDGRAVIYPEPFGSSRGWEDVNASQAREIGRVLAAIHALSTNVIANAGLPVYSAAEWRERVRTELDNVDSKRPIPALLKRRWTTVLDDDSVWQFVPVPVHGDIDADNMLWSESGVSTVLGFGEAKVADPAIDLAPLMALEDSLYSEALDSYEKQSGVLLDDGMYARMQFMSEFAIARWLMHGVLTHNLDIEDEARDMLAELVRQIQDDPEFGGPSWNVNPIDDAEDSRTAANTSVTDAAAQ